MPLPPPDTMNTLPSSSPSRNTVGREASDSSSRPHCRGSAAGSRRLMFLFTGSTSVESEHGHARDVAIGDAPQVVREAERGRFELTVPCAAEQLRVDLVRHAQARGADRM